MYFHLRLREYKRLLHKLFGCFLYRMPYNRFIFCRFNLAGVGQIYFMMQPFVGKVLSYPSFIKYSSIFATVLGSSSKGPKCRACTQSPSLMVKNSAKEQSIFFLRAASSFAHSKSSFETNQAGVSPKSN